MFIELIRNVSYAANQHIRIISDGSCDTEDWSNYDKFNFAITGRNYILKYIKIDRSYFELLYCKSEVNAALVSIGDFLKKKQKISQSPKCIMLVLH